MGTPPKGGVVGHTVDHKGRTKEWLVPAGRLQKGRYHLFLALSEYYESVAE